MPSPIKISYQGLRVTPAGMRVHFAVGNGSWMRHEEVLVPYPELLTDQVTAALDKHIRRRMIEVWSDTPIEGLWDDTPPWV